MLIIDTEYPAGMFETIAVSTATPVALTAKYVTAAGEGKNKDAKEIFLTVEDADVRYTVDGTTPATNVGHKLANNGSLTLKNRNDIVNFKASKISTDAKLRVTYRY